MLKVYSKIKSNRFHYALKLVLAQVCEVEFTLVDNKDELSPTDNVLNYSGERIEGSFQVHPFGLLSEKDLTKFDLSFDYGGDEMVKLFLTEFDDLGFDIFSASFFLASRMEEYWKFDKDKHQRFLSTNSIAHKLGILHLPLINIWGKVFLSKINNHFNLELKTNRVFTVINTIDIDNAWAFRNKGVYRTLGGFGKTLFKVDFKDLNNRFSTLIFNNKDPYDTYDYIEKMSERVKSIYFFLLGDRAVYDKNISHKNRELIQLINRISKKSEIGIHPSYQSFLKPKLQKLEQNRLEKITKTPIHKARKHFLRLSIPESYRIYVENGITDDYTMGYADNVGFRAGICTPFTFFDLLQDKELPITIHPFAYMDGTLNQYLNLSVEESLHKIEFLKNQVKGVNGTFIGIWHNETLNDIGIWKGWRKVYEEGMA